MYVCVGTWIAIMAYKNTFDNKNRMGLDSKWKLKSTGRNRKALFPMPSSFYCLIEIDNRITIFFC